MSLARITYYGVRLGDEPFKTPREVYLGFDLPTIYLDNTIICKGMLWEEPLPKKFKPRAIQRVRSRQELSDITTHMGNLYKDVAFFEQGCNAYSLGFVSRGRARELLEAFPRLIESINHKT